MKMKTNVQYIANATFAKLPDVSSNGRTTQPTTIENEKNDI